MRDIDGRIYLAEVNAILTIDERLLSIEETMTLVAELKRCYEELDVLEELLRTGLIDEEIYNQVKVSE